MTYRGRIIDALSQEHVDIDVEVRRCYLTDVYAMQTTSTSDRVVVAPKREGARKGGLHFTMQLNRAVDAKQASQYVVLTAMAIQQTLMDYEIRSKVKWPSTVTVMHKSIAELSVVYKAAAKRSAIFVTVSVGISEAPEDDATTFARQAVMVSREEVLAKIISNFAAVEKEYYVNVAESYRKIGQAVGKTIVADGRQGQAIGLSQDGYLLVDFDGTIEEVTTEDVEIVGD